MFRALRSVKIIRIKMGLPRQSHFWVSRKPPANEVVQERLLPMASPAAAEAPLCKGSWRRRRLRGCFVDYSETIPPSRHTPCHLPLHKGGERTPPHLRLWGKLANVGSIGGL